MSQNKVFDISLALSNAGIPLSTIEWIDANTFRYGYWQMLPLDAYLAVSSLVDLEDYEDYDGDSRGKPVIFHRYSYTIRNTSN